MSQAKTEYTSSLTGRSTQHLTTNTQYKQINYHQLAQATYRHPWYLVNFYKSSGPHIACAG